MARSLKQKKLDLEILIPPTCSALAHDAAADLMENHGSRLVTSMQLNRMTVRADVLDILIEYLDQNFEFESRLLKREIIKAIDHEVKIQSRNRIEWYAIRDRVQAAVPGARI